MLAGGSNIGIGGDYVDSVEILSHEFATANRKLAKLPKDIAENPSLFLSGDTLLICGGFNNENKCLKQENNSWIEHSTLNNNRTYASAVTTADGTFIFGGEYSSETFEFLPKNSKVSSLSLDKPPKIYVPSAVVTDEA